MYVACGAREIFWRGTVALSLRSVRLNRSIWHDTAVKDIPQTYETEEGTFEGTFESEGCV